MTRITYKHNFSGSNQSPKESDADFDYEDNKNMILSGVKKANLSENVYSYTKLPTYIG